MMSRKASAGTGGLQGDRTAVKSPVKPIELASCPPHATGSRHLSHPRTLFIMICFCLMAFGGLLPDCCCCVALLPPAPLCLLPWCAAL